MNAMKFIKSIVFSSRVLVILTALFIVSLFISVQTPQPVAAVSFNEPDDRIDPNPPAFEVPQGGFTWSVPAHYGRDFNNDLMVDTYWRAASLDYDPNYIYPDYWPMIFWACQSEDDALGIGTTTYDWNIAGNIISPGACAFTYNDFTAQGTYPVTLTVTPQGGTPQVYHQDVYIKDYLLVAIGDSLASGEGNPDRPAPVSDWNIPTGDARWQDLRCDRSANAYPSRAAIALENSDPHTSVTFISFACSGATILTPAWDPIGLVIGWPPLDIHPDANKYRGIGILGPYIGNGWGSYEVNTFIPPQIVQLQTALTPPEGKSQRQFDSLIISAGGNDLHFGDIAMTCLFNSNCYPSTVVFETANQGYDMQTLLNRALTPAAQGGSPTSLPDAYAALATAVEGLDPQPANVYITQYADQTRGDVPSDPSPRYCNMLFDILYPADYGATSSESGPLSQVALGGLNQAILDMVNAHLEDGWHYVDGITSYEVDPDPSKPAGTPGPFVRDENGYGHGYCATDNWIVRADESVVSQGPWPVRLLTKGTLHPNAKGIEVLKNRLLYYMLPDLEATSPDTPVGEPPFFTSSITSGALTSQPGDNGWFTGSCDSNQSCAYARVVLQVTATGSAPLEAANVYINDLDGCSLPGVSCPTTVFTPTNQLVWNFTFLNDGIYQLQFAVSDVNDQISDYVYVIKVDLNPPYAITVPEPFSVDEGSSVTLTAVASDTMSSIINLDWDLDYDGTYETTAEQPSFSATSLDGPTSKTVRVRGTDEAGNFVITTAGINVLNVAPMPEIIGALATEKEGTAISLTSTVTDPGASDIFTYDWTVEKDGVAYDSGSEADFSFTPDDNGSYVVSLSVTDDDSDVGTTSATILVTNVSPSLSNVSVDSATVDEGNGITLTLDINDPGLADSYDVTINWGDGSSPELIALSAGTDTLSRRHTFTDDNPTATAFDTNAIGISITDDDGGKGTGSASVVVNNLPPIVNITAPENGSLSAVNTTINLSASITDASASDSLTCSIDWGDGSTGSGTVTNGVCTTSHAYSGAGVYMIQVTGTDDDLGETTASAMAVVYDPTAGFVTGGGWIDSPAGAFKVDMSLTGKATFGFVSKYQKGAVIPTGNTAFKFDIAGLAFNSDSYEWLVVNQNGTNAQFKGTGKINDTLDPNGQAYKFMVWASDGSPDTFRIRIWWEDAAGEHDVYDNGVSQAIGGGNIVVHIGK